MSYADNNNDGNGNGNGNGNNSRRLFCFSGLGGGTCTASTNGADVFGNLKGGVYRSGNSLVISGINFDFRSYNVGKKGKGKRTKDEDWSLWYHSLGYCSNKLTSQCGINEIPTNHYIVNMTSPQNVSPWEYASQHAVTKEVIYDDNGETYYQVNINITLKDSWLKTLSQGEHMIRFKVHGSATADKDKTFEYHHEDIYIYITFSVPKQVKLTIDDQYNFGTFLSGDFNTSITKPACAHVQGGGNFKLSTSSRNQGYSIKGDNNTTQAIAYEVAFGPNENSLVNIPYGGDETVFTGDASENCNGGDNMNLRVRLADSLESLSVKSADKYSDTLTLTISAQ
ncbi:hypothetical protein ACH42_07775 [Endozoicomonas sp. (ex Bugula neritina AB1)]|nr:hypothetical protein ACH42_07775 [Endozoicomonas sp. (ex Bugula neritina AB1)]